MNMLYKRDYNKGLTIEEKQQYKDITGREFGEEQKNGFGFANSPEKYPKAVRMYKTLFPNNFLDFIELRDEDRLLSANNEFLAILNNEETNERAILNFIRDAQYYHIIGSIMWGLSFNFGHHGAFLFPEFQLSNSYKADYLLIGKSSGGYEFVMVELESIHDRITLSSGELGDSFRKGISQLNSWRRWLENNYSSFGETLKKYKNPIKDLPEEFYMLDMSRFHYVVVAGRRSDFTELTYRTKREKTNNIHILHYDNLFDFSNKLIGRCTY